jgi:hypothetical protein
MKFGILALLALLWTVPALAAPSQDEAVAESKVWLAVVDAKDYPKSWKTAAELFQSGVSEARWDGMVQGIRDKLGPLKSRAFQAAKLTDTLPSMPKGDYAIVRFQTAFANENDTIESITLVAEHGKWKVGGYFIKPASTDTDQQ